MDRHELIDKISQLKNELTGKIVIPVHHYEDPDIVRFADFTGDSYRLAVECSRTDKQFIIFCGVLFMAETAGILCGKAQKVLIPDNLAGCPMASMADLETITGAYNMLTEKTGADIYPVVYMNSYADLKSFCGEHGGSVCTSSNAGKIIEHYFKAGRRVLFFPDYYLGINTAASMGLKDHEIVKVRRNLSMDMKGDIKDAKLFLWDGYCPVHQRFKASDIEHLRDKHKNIRIIVHPECMEDVVNNADMSGSTEMIYKTVKDSPEGSVWGIGTETTFVDRLARENPGKTILPLRESKCVNMVKITPGKLYDSLLSVKNYETDKSLKYEISVDESFKTNARKALEKMIEIVGG